MGRYKDIRDDEIRIISSSQRKTGFRLWGWVCLAVAVPAIILALLLLLNDQKPDMEIETTQVVFEPSNEVPRATEADTKWLGNYTDTTKAYTEHLRDTINDIPLDIYIPHNAVPELVLGVPNLQDKSIVFTTQAADIRADNGKIVGAFVLKGKPLSWGLSKKGYCGIIDGKVTVGVADSSPLFEEATE